LGEGSEPAVVGPEPTPRGYFPPAFKMTTDFL